MKKAILAIGIIALFIGMAFIPMGISDKTVEANDTITDRSNRALALNVEEATEIEEDPTGDEDGTLGLDCVTIWGIVIGREKKGLFRIKAKLLVGAKVTIKEEKIIGGYEETQYSGISGTFMFRNVPKGMRVRVRAERFGYTILQTSIFKTSFISQLFPRIFILIKF